MDVLGWFLKIITIVLYIFLNISVGNWVSNDYLCRFQLNKCTLILFNLDTEAFKIQHVTGCVTLFTCMILYKVMFCIYYEIKMLLLCYVINF